MTLFLVAMIRGAIARVLTVATFTAVPVFQFRGAKIVTGQQMSLWAMGAGGILCADTDSAQRVDTMANRLKVIWSYAQWIAAKVIQFVAYWDRAATHFINPAMGPLYFPATANLAIATGALSDPFPAPVLTDHIANRVGTGTRTADIELDKGAHHSLQYNDLRGAIAI